MPFMRRLLLFAKRPRLGRVKTRLVPALGPERTLALYRAFVLDQIAFLRSCADICRSEIYLDGAWPADFGAPPGADGPRPRLQGAGDLGRRLLRAFERTAAEGTPATVVIGADAPTLPRSRVLRAFELLEAGAEAVVAPALDGGYVLLGASRPLPELFHGVPWGGEDVLRTTLARVRSGRIDLRLLDPWYDVDDSGGLERLRRDLAGAGGERAPATARGLAALGRPFTPVATPCYISLPIGPHPLSAPRPTKLTLS